MAFASALVVLATHAPRFEAQSHVDSGQSKLTPSKTQNETAERNVGSNDTQKVRYQFSKQDDATKLINTIVTDGKGGLEVQLGNLKGMSAVTKGAIRVHEEEHIAQFYRTADARSLALIKNETKQGRPVAPAEYSDWIRAEIGAYAVEIQYYDDKLTEKLPRSYRANIEANRMQIDGFRNMLIRALERNELQ